MANKGRHDLPNLKICVDNTEDGELSYSDSSSDQDDSIDIDEDEAKHVSDNRGEVEFNVTISQAEQPKQKNEERLPFLPRTYENSEGNFVTGIDVTSKEAVAKREERALRFGIENPSTTDIDLKALYKSLGVKDDDFNRGERGIRSEAIHIRGTDNMSTKDIFTYFKEFSPGGVEWIDDASCNAVWADPITAARAMLLLSSSYEEVENPPSTRDKPKNQKTGESSNEEKTKVAQDEKEEKEKEEKEKEETSMDVEEYDDNLDLVGDDKEIEEIKLPQVEEKSEAKADKSDSVEEKSAEVVDMDGSKEEAREKRSIVWPPGKWRLAHPMFKAKNKNMFLRFATKADKKLPRAESRSNYYRKFGNPNFGGMRGLISNSRKKKYKVKTYEEELAETLEAIQSQREAREAMDHDDADVSPVKRGRVDDEESRHMEAELRELLEPSVVKQQRSMRMYADDEEERKNSRLNASTGVMLKLSGTKLKVGKVKDARELIRGVQPTSNIASLSQRGDLRLRIQASPPESDDEDSEEEGREISDNDDSPSSNVMSRLGKVRSAPSDSDSDGSSSDSDIDSVRVQGLHSSVGRVGSDLRSRLGAPKESESTSNRRYPAMRIEVVD